MIIEPKIRGFISLSAHPVGCAELVKRDVEYAKKNLTGVPSKFNRVLVIGASMGYGLATRIAATFGLGAKTVGVIYDREPKEGRTASAGWYNTASFNSLAKEQGLYAATVNGDAFSDEVKNAAADIIERDLGQVDLVVYSLASPRRTVGGVTYNSVLKTVGEPYTQKSLNLRNFTVEEVTVPAATKDEIDATVKVMGGEDWRLWMEKLSNRGLLAKNCTTVCYSYIGPELTRPIYGDGTIGQAKKDLNFTATALQQEGFNAFISANKAVVTQSSAAIPIVPLYLSALYKVMKKTGTHEGTVQQAVRLFSENHLSKSGGGLVRLDNFETDETVQSAVMAAFDAVNSSNVADICDVDGFVTDFHRLFGFMVDGIDYAADADIFSEIDIVHVP